MRIKSNPATALTLIAMLAAPTASGLHAQELDPVAQEVASVTDDSITVYGSLPVDLSGLLEGPDVEGFISSRVGPELSVTNEMGVTTDVVIAEATDIRARGGFLGLDRNTLSANSLLNGLPVKIETVRWEGGLVASKIRFSRSDLETAEMIRRGTDQRFAQQGAAIDENSDGIGANAEGIAENAALAEALRGRVANIDQYNIKSTTNVYFASGRHNLTSDARIDLCNAAREAEAMDNALLLVVGYTDSTGSQEFNQVLSERRAGSVVNHLQQQCSWQPWRMLSPTGMAESDPMADNETAEGRRQNRRVSVNILVSKALEEM